MTGMGQKQQRGFSLVEIAVVIAIGAVIAAFATPKLLNALRDYRLDMSARQLTDLMNRAKSQAVANNRNSFIVIDTANRRIGIPAFDNAGNLMRTDYVTLPQGISFSQPSGVSAPMTGAPTTSAVSFPKQNNSTTVFQQDFTSRGFPVVSTPGQINALYVGNGKNYRVVTLNSVGGLRTFRWQSGAWESVR